MKELEVVGYFDKERLYLAYKLLMKNEDMAVNVSKTGTSMNFFLAICRVPYVT